MAKAKRQTKGRKRAKGRTRKRGRAKRRPSPLLRKRAIQLARIVAIIALPFLLLVRGSVTSHLYLASPGWIAVTLGGLACGLCLSFYCAVLWQRLTGRNRQRQIALTVTLPLVAAFAIYSLGWIAHANAKTPEVVNRWTDLHPTLRLAIGTAGLADADFVVTEIGRSASDYDRMGLRRVSDSLHYEQADGWVHAVDLRTRGRTGLRNVLLQGYFEVAGLDTLRHSGTADHLHVSMPRRPR